jgi:hypothetical protein
MAKFLPKGIQLETRFRLDSVGRSITVLDELRELGAHVKDDQVCDRDGKPLCFYHVRLRREPERDPRLPLGEDSDAMHLRSLSASHHIIYMYPIWPW